MKKTHHLKLFLIIIIFSCLCSPSCSPIKQSSLEQPQGKSESETQETKKEKTEIAPPYQCIIRNAANPINKKQQRPFLITYYLFEDNTDIPIYLTQSQAFINFDVDCDNDGVFEFKDLNTDLKCHYIESGFHQIAIRGDLPGLLLSDDEEYNLYFNAISIDQWGDIRWKNLEEMAANTVALNVNAKDVPNLEDVCSLKRMFHFATGFNADLNNWDVSRITNMSGIFSDATEFNQPLHSWNVSHVTDMSAMFSGATKFNQPLDKWDTSSVENMEYMFRKTDNFNQPLESWNVSNVKTMTGMFAQSKSFNQSINSWNVKNVQNFREMFYLAESYSQPLNSWSLKTNAVVDSMFYNTQKFNNINESTISNFSQYTNTSKIFEKSIYYYEF